MNFYIKNKAIICVLSAFVCAFSNFPFHNSLELSIPLYGFSYSEDFSNMPDNVIGLRSDEYGLTTGAVLTYRNFNPDSRLSLGVSLNFARSINHTYDGSYFNPDTVLISGIEYIIHFPLKTNANNLFYGASARIGYLIHNNNHNRRLFFEPNLAVSFNYWHREPVNHHYCWLRILPGVSLMTQNERNSGITSSVALSIPAWQMMYFNFGNDRYDFDIGGKLGWQFEFGLVRFLSNDRTLKITYFYENYGFSESDIVSIGGVGTVLEPASRTNNHGIKFSIERGIGGK